MEKVHCRYADTEVLVSDLEDAAQSCPGAIWPRPGR